MRWRSDRILRTLLAIISVMAMTAMVKPARAAEPAANLPSPGELLSRMRHELTPKPPGDVDRTLQKQFRDSKLFAEEQLLFDILSWRTFVALNWPVNEQGRPKGKITDPRRKFWD